MKKPVFFMGDREVTPQIIRSSRKTLAVQITPAGEVVVRAPNRLARRQIDAFLESRRGWIEEHLGKQSQRPALPPFTPEELGQLKRQAAQILAQRVPYFARMAGVDYGRITVRSQRTRWGSCSAEGNLNFNCLLALTPPEVLDYVVVHELCHRKEMNHSARFWAEVEKFCPDYPIYRKWLKDNGSGLLARLPEK